MTLELGGNDAAIVLADANPAAVAQGIFMWSMTNSGQVCMAIKRLYVHESIFKDVVGVLAEMAKGAKVGDGFGEGVMFGPMACKMQFDRVNELLQDAKDNGAEFHAGGEALPGDGYFIPPTIITGVKEGVRIVDEEQFGPALPIIPFTDVDDVIRRANGTKFGLGASVWGTDLEKASEVAFQLEAGNVWINTHGKLSPDVPFGGVKESGVGRQLGDGLLEGLTDAKVIRVPKPQQ